MHVGEPVGSPPQVESEMRVEEREGSGLSPRCPTAVGAHKTPTTLPSTLAPTGAKPIRPLYPHQLKTYHYSENQRAAVGGKKQTNQ